MTIARNIDRGVLVGAAVALALPAATRANPLLSGYGAPGQGGQVLLGSTLTGPRGGGGSGPAGDGTAAIEIRASRASALQTPSSRPAGTRARRSGRGRGGGSATTGVLPGGGGAAKTGIEPARSVSTDVAGLSSGDLALVLVGMGAIAATGILMARLARGEERKGQRS